MKVNSLFKKLKRPSFVFFKISDPMDAISFDYDGDV